METFLNSEIIILISLSTTRWCGFEDACKSLSSFMTSVRDFILQQFGKPMIKMQTKVVDISTAFEMHDSLATFLSELQPHFSI
ncbi:hypothetical protein PR048_013021 [Dryococelus australis]|uniref:Uncharacterized protein n=1 Tax=Dryococelus australis TaxID=614101 RepID=A0ABQ9HRT9_9NEOP|nr:hypothetical protein PR048_013021 [Dryococelus australis]